MRVLRWLIDYGEAAGRELGGLLNSALGEAVERGQLKSCELLAARGAEAGSASRRLVHSIRHNHKLVADWLIENGGDFNAIGSAQFSAQDEATSKLPNHHTTVALSPLAAAIAMDDKYWVDRLFELGADVNVVGDQWGISPLMVAC